MSNEVKTVKLQLVGLDGNAFALMAAFRRAPSAWWRSASSAGGTCCRPPTST